MIKFVWIILVMFLFGCTKPAEESHRVNTQFSVEKLFTHEGCSVYRFEDNRYHYYVKCNNSSAVIEQYSQTCGKGHTCTYSDNIETEY